MFKDTHSVLATFSRKRLLKKRPKLWTVSSAQAGVQAYPKLRTIGCQAKQYQERS